MLNNIFHQFYFYDYLKYNDALKTMTKLHENFYGCYGTLSRNNYRTNLAEIWIPVINYILVAFNVFVWFARFTQKDNKYVKLQKR